MSLLLQESVCEVQNHCCAPSMYTKVVEAEGESRLVFFARTDIKPGQELTYDYRSVHCLLATSCADGSAILSLHLPVRSLTRLILACDTAKPKVKVHGNIGTGS